jgi:hypothetical protein
MDWKENGVKIVRAGELDTNTPQTSGMTRAAAITHARTGANKLWAGNVPPYVPHQEINASANEVCEAVVIRNGQDPIVVNLELILQNRQARGIPGCRSILTVKGARQTVPRKTRIMKAVRRRLQPHFFVAMCSDKDDRTSATLGVQLRLQFEARHPASVVNFTELIRIVFFAPLRRTHEPT